ncbi:cell division protein [Nonlabens spongiae]|uniref:Cell division protein n=1 Tax=Nonlabens spongiae TaxID=331648 RepID=A0A1W6MIC1_9FLAO|nr:SRPBCC family protein [Nonlabens spongiae]ARN77358.1 cell division protein [Nonlabens spongiae]
MPTIHLETIIKADIEIVFDLSRSIDLHTVSAGQTGETAIAGKTSGLIGLNESVTWRARHFGINQTLTSKITAYDRPLYFVDEMVNGAFKSFKHEHHLRRSPQGTLMTDCFQYQSPFGILGNLADFLFLKKYMKNFLTERNQVLKQYAESGVGKNLLSQNTDS